MTGEIDIAIVESPTTDDLRRLEALLPLLSSTATFDPDRVRAMIDAPGVKLFVARDAGEVVGMATLVTFPLVSGWRHRPPAARGDHRGIDSSAASHPRPHLPPVA